MKKIILANGVDCIRLEEGDGKIKREERREIESFKFISIIRFSSVSSYKKRSLRDFFEDILWTNLVSIERQKRE